MTHAFEDKSVMMDDDTIAVDVQVGTPSSSEDCQPGKPGKVAPRPALVALVIVENIQVEVRDMEKTMQRLLLDSLTVGSKTGLVRCMVEQAGCLTDRTVGPYDLQQNRCILLSECQTRKVGMQTELTNADNLSKPHDFKSTPFESLADEEASESIIRTRSPLPPTQARLTPRLQLLHRRNVDYLH